MHKIKDLARQFLPQILVISLAVALRVIPGPRTIDDAFITYRYARNILSGNGFVYNPGESVLGTTTPLYTFLMVALGAVTGGESAPFPVLAMLLNALADGVTCLLIIQLGQRFKANRAGWAAAIVWAVVPASVTFAIGGLETSVYVLLIVSTLVTYFNRRYTTTAITGALAFITRPDALILLGPLILDRAITGGIIQKLFPRLTSRKAIKRIPVQQISFAELCAFLLPTLLWITYATATFGTPLPHSILAKSQAYRLPANASLITLMQHFATPFMGDQTLGVYWIAFGLFIYPSLFAIGAIRLFRCDPRSWTMSVFPWLYFLAFAVPNPLIFRWYLTPPLPLYIFTILYGLNGLLETNNSIDMQKNRVITPLRARILPLLSIVLIFILPIGFSLRNWVLKPDHGLSRPAPQMAWYKLELLYHQAANSLIDEINSHTTRPTLAAGDVGVLGFFTDTIILDTVGLNSPQTLEYYPLDESFYTINYAVPPDLIIDKEPDYVVLLEVYGREGLFQDPRFQDMYDLQQKLPTDIYGSDGMLIFVKR